MATRVASIVADIGVNTKNFDKGIQSVVKSLGIAKGDFVKFGAAIGAAGAIVGAIATQLKKASDVTMTYADQVRTLSSVTNQSAEKTSIMIQVLDDYKISAEQAGSAARFLAKEGLSLNVETLAKLSEEYKKLNSGQERAEFLMKKFGKAGQDFALIMEQGADAILNQGDAVKKGLILTEKQLQQARDLEIAQDDLNDTIQEYNVIVGSQVIPLQIQWAKAWISLADGSVKLRNALDYIIAAPIDSATQSYIAMAKTAEEALGDVADSAGGVEDVIRGLSEAEESFLTSTRDMTPQAVAEFVTLQTKIAQVKQMIAAGASFNVIVNFLAGKTIMVVPGQMAPTQQQWSQSQAAAAQTSAQTAAAVANAQGSQKTVIKGKEAVGGPTSKNGWTMVGEAGPELISPSGMVINAHNTKRMLSRGWGGRRMAVGGLAIPSEPGDVFQPGNVGSGGLWDLGDIASDVAPSAGVLQAWSSGGGGGGSSAVIQTAAAASQAAEQTTRAVNVTAQMASQQALAAAQQAASLASIDRRLANLPTQIRDAFQQVIQQ